MSLSEQFAEKYMGENHDPEVCNRHTPSYCVKILIDELKLDDIRNAFILSKNQFAHLAELFVPMTTRDYGLYGLQFHPKSGHIVYQYRYHAHIGDPHHGDYIYPTRGLSKDFEYFRWSFNSLFMEKWIYFSNIIEDSDCEYVLYNHDQDGDHFTAYDINKDLYYKMGVHVGGGRLYNEPSGEECVIHQEDTVIE